MTRNLILLFFALWESECARVRRHYRGIAAVASTPSDFLETTDGVGKTSAAKTGGRSAIAETGQAEPAAADEGSADAGDAAAEKSDAGDADGDAGGADAGGEGADAAGADAAAAAGDAADGADAAGDSGDAAGKKGDAGDAEDDDAAEAANAGEAADTQGGDGDEPDENAESKKQKAEEEKQQAEDRKKEIQEVKRKKAELDAEAEEDETNYVETNEQIAERMVAEPGSIEKSPSEKHRAKDFKQELKGKEKDADNLDQRNSNVKTLISMPHEKLLYREFQLATMEDSGRCPLGYFWEPLCRNRVPFQTLRSLTLFKSWAIASFLLGPCILLHKCGLGLWGLEGPVGFLAWYGSAWYLFIRDSKGRPDATRAALEA